MNNGIGSSRSVLFAIITRHLHLSTPKIIKFFTSFILLIVMKLHEWEMFFSNRHINSKDYHKSCSNTRFNSTSLWLYIVSCPNLFVFIFMSMLYFMHNTFMCHFVFRFYTCVTKSYPQKGFPSYLSCIFLVETHFISGPSSLWAVLYLIRWIPCEADISTLA